MQLKQLEIAGFKSFSKKTVIDFVPGITAIVGPNGSGKSNVVDAIRWVLAEQSFKNLRGRKGDDLIFHGSTARSAMARARVELTLVNSHNEAALELSEVALSREVKKGGDNTYRINERSVRLLDFEEFLSRSGVGASTFRILSQGMSDILLTLGPREFRLFIEEAAGLKEFQDKKNRSLSKLDYTRENLSRVEAVIAEIAPQLRFLKKGAQKFVQRAEIEEECRDRGRNLFGYRFKKLEERGEKAAEEKKKVTLRIREAEAALKTLEKEFMRREPEGDTSRIRAELDELEKLSRELSRSVIRLEGRVEIEKEREDTLLPVTQTYIRDELSGLLERVKGSIAKGGFQDATRHIITALSRLIKEMEEGKKEKHTSAVPKIEREIREKKKEQEAVEDKITLLRRQYEEATSSLSELKKNIMKREKHYREAGDELRKLEKELSSIELETERVAMAREQLVRSIESLELFSLDSLSGHKFAPPTDEEKEEKKVWQLKKQLNEIGEMDREIEEEFRAAEERHSFLTAEKADLERALESLSDMIADLENEMDRRFTSSMKEVSSRFDHNIKLMFGGGSGGLSLVRLPSSGTGNETEEADDEETGIRIDVELPNKKVRNLTMLSGGERTLVSIALLFSLVNVRKPPFLVLDEIDAALDETNSQKFVKLLRNLTGTTQVVLITHNRETMRGADALYGVSMKDGISQLLSLRLAEVAKTGSD
jgi:chromosome segregation protein